jgi:hypothetical protein
MTVSIDRLSSKSRFGDSATHLKQVLQDIVDHLVIESNLTITHPEYGIVKLPAELQQRFEILSAEAKDHYLQAKLRRFIFDNYCRLITDSQGVKASKWSSKNELLHELLHHNDGHGKGYYQSGWLIVGEIERFVQVKKDGLTLHIERERHLKEEESSAKIGDIVAVRMPPQKAEHDFSVAIGTAGSIDHLDLETDAQIVDIYLNLSAADGALLLMESLTKELNTVEIPFHFKVLYRPEEYSYCDTARLSFVKKEYNQVQSIIDTIYQTYQAHFQLETLLFTKYLAPGLSVGERPNLQTDLTQHRCQLIAEGLITAWQNEQTSPVDKYKFISDRFQHENISLEQPYLNPHSTDIYKAISVNEMITDD